MDPRTQSKQLGAKEEARRKTGLPEKLHEDRSEKFVEDGLGSCESVLRTSCGYHTHRKVNIEKADGSSITQERVGIAFL